MATERRKHVRYFPKDNACAALGSQNIKVGMILDISRGGLSFGVALDDDSEPEKTVEIFLMDNGFYLSNLPCTSAYNMPITTNNSNQKFAATFMTTRYGLQFGQLTAEQEEQLQFFLENHVSGLATS